jgi:hypothetical protein
VLALVVQDGNGGGGFTPGSRDRQRGNLSEARQLTESSATDDSNADRAYAICDCQHDSGGAGRGAGRFDRLGKDAPSYVLGRAVILLANCFADSIRRKGLVIEES